MRQRAVVELFKQDDGLSVPLQRCGLVRAHAADIARAVHVAAHHGEGLLVPALACAQLAHRFRLGQTGQVHSAQPLHAHYLPGLERAARQLYGVARHRTPMTVQEKALRPALGAAVRLRVIAPVAYVRKLRRAVAAHRERRHRRARAVIGHGLYDCEPRSAVGAVNKWIFVPAIRRVEQLTRAVGADADIRRNQRLHVPRALALYDAKTAVFARFYGGILHALDQRQGRRRLF